MAERKTRYYYKTLDQVTKANPAFGDTKVQDRNMFIAFVLAIKYLYSYENGNCEKRPKIESWLHTTDANWYYSGSFDEPRCVQILNQFRENFKKYKDLDCFKCFADPSIFNIQTAGPYNDYIFNETSGTKYVFDLNEYFAFLDDGKGNFKEPGFFKKDQLQKDSESQAISKALKSMEQTIIKNANDIAKNANNIARGGNTKSNNPPVV